MRYFSTRGKNNPVSFAKAALAGLAPDGGLYVPEEIPQLPASVKSSLGTMAYADIAFETIKPWVIDDIPPGVLEEMVHSAYPFSAPLVRVGDLLVLELFHGPTAAFKDFGARFMARSFSYLRRGEHKPLTILTATSGDTGGAVADGFYGTEDIYVTVLYPKGRVSALQEKQIAGLGKNIRALAVEGSFDDCQRLVKEAFADAELKERLALASANSINVARLIPQAAYYASAAGRAFAGRVDPDGEATPRASGALRGNASASHVADGGSANHNRSGSYANHGRSGGSAPVISVPSGNFGNLTAGLYAYKMGAPIARFIAATNINRTVPDYLESGKYEARLSQATISNAMDVGAPSNFERMSSHFSLEELRHLITGVSVTDDETRRTISDVFEKGYFIDPHSAVGWRAVEKSGLLSATGNLNSIVISTAHPAKFADTDVLCASAPVPPSLRNVIERKTTSSVIPAELDALKGMLL